MLTFEEIKSPLKFLDISSELYRTYYYPGGGTFTVEKPVGLNISKSGGHKIIAADGNNYYIKFGWIVIGWKKAEGAEEWLF